MIKKIQANKKRIEHMYIFFGSNGIMVIKGSDIKYLTQEINSGLRFCNKLTHWLINFDLIHCILIESYTGFWFWKRSSVLQTIFQK